MCMRIVFFDLSQIFPQYFKCNNVVVAVVVEAVVVVVVVVVVSRTCDYFSHQVSSRSLHSKRFPRLYVPLTPPNVTGSSQDFK